MAAVLAAGSTFASSALRSRPVLADHGNSLFGNSGMTGYWNGPLWRCESNQPHIVIYAPDAVGASYEKDDALAQLVYWTPRVWWVGSDNVFHHSYADSYGSDFGWYRAWVRPGDSHDGLIVYPERGSTGGASGAVAWFDGNGVTMTANPFTLTWSPTNPSGNFFMVEWIFYWASNDEQPYDGWLSRQIDMGDGYGGRWPGCGLR